MVRLSDSLWNKLILWNKNVHYGHGLQIHGRIHVHGKKGGITIGDNCKIISKANINPTAGDGSTHFSVWSGGRIAIGNNCGISLACITATESVVIHDNVLIGAGVAIFDSDFHPVNYYDRLNNKVPDSVPVVLKEGCFIGARSIIMKGVTIGARSVVGAGSVVTKSIPDNEVWGGNPAKFIRAITNED